VLVTEVRRFRADQGLRPGQRVAARLLGDPAHEPLVRALARLDPPGEGFSATATLAAPGGVTVELDTRGTIDVAAERARLSKDRAAAEKEAASCRAKLGNEAFLAKAPEQVVAKMRERLARAEAELARIDSALAALPSS
jgi:valyl-tRNA synthetase